MLSGIGSYNDYSSYMQNQALSRSDPSDMFGAADTDDSGGISRTELEDWIVAMSENTGAGIDGADAVSTYDADGDGELNEEELGSFMKETMPPPPGMMGMGPSAPAEGLFQALDTDGSSGVSGSELSEWVDAMAEEGGDTIDSGGVLSEYDTDEDGELSSSELDSFLTASGIGGPAVNSGDEASASAASSGSSGSAISAYDINEDGILSGEELQAYLDDVEANASSPRVQDAISKYSMNYGGSEPQNPRDAFMSPDGMAGSYSPIDIPA